AIPRLVEPDADPSGKAYAENDPPPREKQPRPQRTQGPAEAATDVGPGAGSPGSSDGGVGSLGGVYGCGRPVVTA
ncbi:hypothetical protein ACFYM5_12665, partial [Streptomyces sp. NPDC006706]